MPHHPMTSGNSISRKFPVPSFRFQVIAKNLPRNVTIKTLQRAANNSGTELRFMVVVKEFPDLQLENRN
jgi:hypothetical protein